MEDLTFNRNGGFKEIYTIGENLYRVESEPGDMTLYDYFVYRIGDDFNFMKRKSTFNFPDTLNYWNVKDVSEIEDLMSISTKKNCNPYTLKECIDTVKIIHTGLTL